jgi:apolipoprotein N-acyltransferase
VQVRPQRAGKSDPAALGKRWRALFFPALVTAALLWCCYFPLNQGWMAWFSMVPFLSLVRSPARPRRLYLVAWMGAFAFFLAALQWVRVADYRMYATWVGLAIICSVYALVGLYLVRRLDRRTRLPLVITFPVVWTALEFARAHLLLGGFPWYFLGHTQHEFLALVQIADLGGVYAVTFLLAAVNACFFEWLCPRPWFKALFSLPAPGLEMRSSALWIQSGAVLALIGVALGYGAWRLGQADFQEGPRVALLQGSLDQRLRNEASSPNVQKETLSKVRRHYNRLGDEAAARHPDLIVWPETSFVYGWLEVDPGLAPEQIPEDWQDVETYRRDLLRRATLRWPANLLVGVGSAGLGPDGREHRYNSAVLIEQAGTAGGKYDKIHCVPFGEYVPFRDVLPWMNTFAPYDFDYSITPGEQMTRFPLGKYHFGVVICYEDTDPYLARQYVRPGLGKPEVDFLLNISNDGWFDGTSEHEEHLAICRFRAIECRRAVARAVNMGISAVIDGNGRVVALPGPDWAGSKKIETVLTATIPIDHRASLYARIGDWLPWTCWLIVGVGLVGPSLWPARLRRSA